MHPDYITDLYFVAVLLLLGWIGKLLGGLLGRRREQDSIPVDDARETYRRLRERANR